MILRHLQQRVAPGQLTRLALTARVVDAEFAREIGLIHVVAADSDIQAAAADELNHLLAGAPRAQSRFKSLARDLSALPFSDRHAIQESCTAIAEARTGSEGQAGLKSFFDKSPPPWRGAIPNDWKIPWV
jgi:methylglutaconyl-CoA hydratase